MFLDVPRPELSQGDIISNIQIYDGVQESKLHPVACHVAILTNDCDIDKPKLSVLTVTRVTPLTEVEKGPAGDIRAGRVAGAWLLPAIAGLPESFVDFRFVYRLLKVRAMEALSSGARVASMSDDGRLALLQAFHHYLIRTQPPKANSP